MTLDDAIAAFGQVASDDLDSIELDVRDYERLVKWLTELKLARESAFSDIGLAARAVSENHKLKAENGKLRELAGAVREFVGDVNCDACSLRSQCDGNNRMACGLELSYHAFEAMRDLGIEVDG